MWIIDRKIELRMIRGFLRNGIIEECRSHRCHAHLTYLYPSSWDHGFLVYTQVVGQPQ